MGSVTTTKSFTTGVLARHEIGDLMLSLSELVAEIKAIMTAKGFCYESHIDLYDVSDETFVYNVFVVHAAFVQATPELRTSAVLGAFKHHLARTFASCNRTMPTFQVSDSVNPSLEAIRKAVASGRPIIQVQ